jgi:DNA anti-recombination protein RmuC
MRKEYIMTKREDYLKELNDELNKYTRDLADFKNDIKQKTSKDFTKAFEAAQTSLKHATKAYESLKSAAEKDWGKLADSTKEVFATLGESFKELSLYSLERLSEWPAQLNNRLKEQVKSNPLASIVIALGIGVILGKKMK